MYFFAVPQPYPIRRLPAHLYGISPAFIAPIYDVPPRSYWRAVDKRPAAVSFITAASGRWINLWAAHPVTPQSMGLSMAPRRLSMAPCYSSMLLRFFHAPVLLFHAPALLIYAPALLFHWSMPFFDHRASSPIPPLILKGGPRLFFNLPSLLFSISSQRTFLKLDKKTNTKICIFIFFTESSLNHRILHTFFS